MLTEQKKKQYRVFIILILAALCVAVFAVWMIGLGRGKNARMATITYHGEVIEQIDLSSVRETRTFTVGEPGAENTIQVSPDGIGVIAADCPDQICVGQGIRSHGPEPIVCLPHQLSIRFSENTAADQDDAAGADAGLDAVTGK